MNGLRMLAVTIAALTASCSEFHAKEGGETHFLKECSEDGCPNGLSCVCGVCTTSCADDGACTPLGDRAACEGMRFASLVCGDEVPAAQICDATCANDAQCEARGEGYACVHGRCRPEAIATAVDERDACEDGGCPDDADPLVLIVLDTSGSMERKTDCVCTSASCEECLPQCSTQGSEKNRWAQALEALTGTFDDFSCETQVRSDFDSSSYDFTYPLPYHEPKGVQRADGILQTYAARVRFGIATMDSIRSYGRDEQRSIEEYAFTMAADEAGLWSYPATRDASEVESRPEGGAIGAYRYPGCPQPFFENTGIRNRDAASGALLVEMAEDDDGATEEAIRRTLLLVRPYGGTPIASALDDVRALFENDPSMAAERTAPLPPHVILITDSRPDDDFRANNCDCNEPESGKDGCAGLLTPAESASEMHCPYPTPENAARALRCGATAECDAGVVAALHVIGFAVSDDEIARAKVETIASAGGTDRGVFVANRSELRSALASILEGILDGSTSTNHEPTRQSCAVGDLIYEDGASWQDACGFCDCENGVNACTDIGCFDCIFDSDCGDGQVCRSGGVGCGAGACVSATIPAVGQCDAPTNVTSFCGCDGETHASPCEASTGVAHYGACEPASCVRGDEAIAHGASVMDPCNRCTCIDGELLCTDRACE